jgi:hypothetical protein
MNAPFSTAPTSALPAELDLLSPPPLLLRTHTTKAA